jgi:methyl-accepting chemotaxis protein
MKKNISLATKFTLTLLIILFIGQGIAFFFFIMSMRGSLLDSLDEKTKNSGNLLSGISIKPIMDKDDSLIDEYLKEIIKDQDILSIKVFDQDQNLLGEKTKLSPQDSSRKNPFSIKPTLELKVPIISDEKKIGGIHIISSTASIIKALYKHIFFGFIQEGILLVIIIFLIFDFFNRNVKKPISDFVVAVSKVNAGDFTTSINSGNNNEMMTLSREFNSLVLQLRNVIKKLFLTSYGVTGAINRLDVIIDQIVGGTNKQIDATEDTIIAMEKAEVSQKLILDNTVNLAEFSEENAASFTQSEASAKEITTRTKELSKYSLEVYSIIADLLHEAKGITKSTEDLLSISEETTATAEQLGANLNEIKGSTTESERIAFEVSEVLSDTRVNTIGDAVNSMDEVENAVNNNLQLVKNLEMKSKDVEKVLTVVNDVTKQTNLLSVNAAILASQAGEYGTGFAVVADEIKMLADRTASSSKEITNIIKTIQSEVAISIIATEESKRVVNQGKTLVLRTDSAIVNVLERAQRSSMITKKIQVATEEQVKGISQLNDAMEHLVTIASGVAEIVREQEKKSKHVLNITEKFKDISGFIKNSTQEQSTGMHLIAKNFEHVNEMIKGINKATSEQDRSNKDILAIAGDIKTVCNKTLAVTQEIIRSFHKLRTEAETLKRDVERFKIE